MLKLRRRPGETLIFETEQGRIRIYFGLDHQQIKLSIQVPKTINIIRGELPEADNSREHKGTP